MKKNGIFLKFQDSSPTPWCLCFPTPILQTLPFSLPIERNCFDMKNLAAIVLAVSCAMCVVDADDEDGTCVLRRQLGQIKPVRLPFSGAVSRMATVCSWRWLPVEAGTV
jgi:hypothetical protein